MPKADFVPVILGSDHTAYGMARSFHEQYGIKSKAVGVGQLTPTRDSKIISVDVCENLKQSDIFVEKLTDLAGELKEKAENLILIACNENYSELVVRNKEALKNEYIIPFVDEKLMDQLIYKENFYRLCEKHNLDYAKTIICTVENKDNLQINFNFPVVIKPDDSVLYFNTSFRGKRKAYIAHNNQEAGEIIERIYSSNYQHKLIIQEYVPGDDTNMRVLYGYVGLDKKVKLLCLGRILLQDCTPLLIGNYLTVINEYNEELYLKYKAFLEEIGYHGYTNIDLKYDPRDGKLKVFEVNIRPGRSCYFVTGSGYNLARYLVDDLIYNKQQPLVLAGNEHLWLGISKRLLFKYLEDRSLKAYVDKLIRQKKYCRTLPYRKDRNLKRTVRDILYNYEYYRRFLKYYKKYE